MEDCDLRDGFLDPTTLSASDRLLLDVLPFRGMTSDAEDDTNTLSLSLVLLLLTGVEDKGACFFVSTGFLSC